MAKTLLNARIKHRTDTTANWTNKNPKLFQGEFALEKTSTGFKFKVGDGTHNWNDLPYLLISFDNASITYLEDLKTQSANSASNAANSASAANTSKNAAAESASAALDAMNHLLVLLNNPRLEYDENGHIYVNYGGEVTGGSVATDASILFEILNRVTSVRTSETNAVNSANSANTSQTNAKTSETNAANSASEADTAKADALAYKQAAEEAKNLALQYKNQAEAVAQELVDIRNAPRFEFDANGHLYFNYGGAN